MTTYRFGFQRKGRYYEPQRTDNLQGYNMEADQRERDQRFQRALAVAIWNGDHLPAGTPRPVRPLVLQG
jgi:hypothetical protein